MPRTPDDYLGSCDIPGSDTVALQVLDYGGGQHVVIRSAGRTLLCGLQDRLVEVLFTTTEPVAVASDGVTVGGKPYRFVPELSRYLPGADANGVQSLIAEIRAKGYRVETDAAVFATLDLEKWGGPGTAFSWNEGVAFKPEAGPVAVYPFDTNGKREVMYPYPHATGKVSVPGHAFLAVQTLQPGGPNGADVLVLEYVKTAGVLRPIFHDSSDGAGFHENSVFTASKHYLPQGGFETYVTDFQWDEKGYTFVRAETTKAGK